MSKRFILIAAAIGLFITGCANTTFTEYRGQGFLEGKGGTIRTVKGIDFWEMGRPDRKYQIIGVIDDSRQNGIFARASDKDNEIAKVAREHGGDAVILAGTDREVAGIDAYGNVLYRRNTKLLLVKYVE